MRKATREAGSRTIAPFHKTRESHRIITPDDSPFPIERGNESGPRFPTPHPPTGLVVMSMTFLHDFLMS